MNFLRKTKDYMQNIARNLAEKVLEKTKDGEVPDKEIKKVEMVMLNVYDLCEEQRKFFLSIKFDICTKDLFLQYQE